MFPYMIEVAIKSVPIFILFLAHNVLRLYRPTTDDVDSNIEAFPLPAWRNNGSEKNNVVKKLTWDDVLGEIGLTSPSVSTTVLLPLMRLGDLAIHLIVLEL